MQKELILAVLILMMSISSAFSDRPLISVHAGASGQYPVNGFIPGDGFGGLGYIQIGGMYSSMDFIASSGYIYHLKESAVNSFNEIPIMGGVKFDPEQSPVYFSGDLGTVIEQLKYGASSSTSSSANFGWDVGIGVETGPINLQVTYNGVQIKGNRDAMSVSANLFFKIWENL